MYSGHQIFNHTHWAGPLDDVALLVSNTVSTASWDLYIMSALKSSQWRHSGVRKLHSSMYGIYGVIEDGFSVGKRHWDLIIEARVDEDVWDAIF